MRTSKNIEEIKKSDEYKKYLVAVQNGNIKEFKEELIQKSLGLNTTYNGGEVYAEKSREVQETIDEYSFISNIGKIDTPRYIQKADISQEDILSLIENKSNSIFINNEELNNIQIQSYRYNLLLNKNIILKEDKSNKYKIMNQELLLKIISNTKTNKDIVLFFTDKEKDINLNKELILNLLNLITKNKLPQNVFYKFIQKHNENIININDNEINLIINDYKNKILGDIKNKKPGTDTYKSYLKTIELCTQILENKKQTKEIDTNIKGYNLNRF